MVVVVLKTMVQTVVNWIILKVVVQVYIIKVKLYERIYEYYHSDYEICFRLSEIEKNYKNANTYLYFYEIKGK